MELKNCKVCGDLFLHNNGDVICSKCLKKDEEEFGIVKSFLWDNPKATLPQVVDNTGVSEKKIIRYIKEGRIMLADMSEVPNYCEMCGKLIAQGRICSECIGELQKAINSTNKDGDKFFNFTAKNK